MLALDCDKIYHELLETNVDMLAEIEARFPAVFKNGKLDRKMLGAIVFAVPEALRDLNAITHRYVREDIYRRLREYVWQGGTVAVVDAIALFESGISEDCVFTVGVTAPDDERCARIMARATASTRTTRSRALRRSRTTSIMKCAAIICCATTARRKN